MKFVGKSIAGEYTKPQARNETFTPTIFNKSFRIITSSSTVGQSENCAPQLLTSKLYLFIAGEIF